MAIDERYMISAPLDQNFVDKDSGLPLSGGTLEFYADNSRNNPKTVYELAGSPPSYRYTALPNPVTLSGAGTIVNAAGDSTAIYYYPYDADGNVELYYVVCKNSAGVEQWSREAWPNINTNSDPTNEAFPVQNQIFNPQFTRVFVNQDPGETTTYSVAGATDQVFAFAPGWDFVISGTGSVTVERRYIEGNNNVVTSPPYDLKVDVSSGITTCYLRQRFYENSGLWASTVNKRIYLAGVVVARNVQAGDVGIEMFYSDPNSGDPVTIISSTVTGTGYAEVIGITEDFIPPSANGATGKDGYIDIYLSFSAAKQIFISSVQVIPTTSTLAGDLSRYDLNSSNREQALMGGYYIPRLEQKRIPSILTGWDFRLNPAQFGSSGNIGTSAEYILDQTIAKRGSTGNVAYTLSNHGVKFTTAGTDDSFCLIQYLDAPEAYKIIGSRLSVNICGWKTASGDAVTARAYLFRGSSSASFPTLPTVIGTLAADGTFTLTASNWTEISRGGLPTAKAKLKTVTDNSDINSGVDYSFSGWEVTDNTEIGNTNKFAIVVTFHYEDASTVIELDSISVNLGDIPTRPAPLTKEQVYSECEYYYEKSYDNSVQPGGLSSNGEITGFSGSGSSNFFEDVRYRTIKRPGTTIPRIYNPATGTENSIRSNDNNNVTASPVGYGEKGFGVESSGPTDGIKLYSFQYYIDRRIGHS